MALPGRLHSLYELCLPGLPLWDLCCDHGLLGLWALERGAHTEVIFNDAVAHVLTALPAKIAGRPGRVVCANAEDISEPLLGNVVLAGIGGEKVVKILQAHARRGGLRAKRIAVCPEKDALWMLAQVIPGYRLCEQREIPHNHGTRWIAYYVPDAAPHTSAG